MSRLSSESTTESSSATTSTTTKKTTRKVNLKDYSHRREEQPKPGDKRTIKRPTRIWDELEQDTSHTHTHTHKGNNKPASTTKTTSSSTSTIQVNNLNNLPEHQYKELYDHLNLLTVDGLKKNELAGYNGKIPRRKHDIIELIIQLRTSDDQDIYYDVDNTINTNNSNNNNSNNDDLFGQWSDIEMDDEEDGHGGWCGNQDSDGSSDDYYMNGANQPSFHKSFMRQEYDDDDDIDGNDVMDMELDVDSEEDEEHVALDVDESSFEEDEEDIEDAEDEEDEEEEEEEDEEDDEEDQSIIYTFKPLYQLEEDFGQHHNVGLLPVKYQEMIIDHLLNTLKRSNCDLTVGDGGGGRNQMMFHLALVCRRWYDHVATSPANHVYINYFGMTRDKRHLAKQVITGRITSNYTITQRITNLTIQYPPVLLEDDESEHSFLLLDDDQDATISDDEDGVQYQMNVENDEKLKKMVESKMVFREAPESSLTTCSQAMTQKYLLPALTVLSTLTSLTIVNPQPDQLTDFLSLPSFNNLSHLALTIGNIGLWDSHHHFNLWTFMSHNTSVTSFRLQMDADESEQAIHDLFIKRIMEEFCQKPKMKRLEYNTSLGQYRSYHSSKLPTIAGVLMANDGLDDKSYNSLPYLNSLFKNESLTRLEYTVADTEHKQSPEELNAKLEKCFQQIAWNKLIKHLTLRYRSGHGQGSKIFRKLIGWSISCVFGLPNETIRTLALSSHLIIPELFQQLANTEGKNKVTKFKVIESLNSKQWKALLEWVASDPVRLTAIELPAVSKKNMTTNPKSGKQQSLLSLLSRALKANKHLQRIKINGKISIELLKRILVWASKDSMFTCKLVDHKLTGPTIEKLRPITYYCQKNIIKIGGIESMSHLEQLFQEDDKEKE
ncbi:hypothetical protein SAMD00019534_076490 [Acytostelium subglobosum LB1]|uniref:hypothetical protein n=1 Tax=Acytostelium subglobosum LB1 TaxID=1410327 RepID=UPI0006450F77|nr:hypothetical protein SAMD00019534_076490 [Acytostelium subglobosum LB1]GAM24474.1 hypothetical protein SAMD00019534_076490 [Acytostelium subglobosum LB1]|eukprot:XP_012752800.1 hypothetical protein SAMD00019534_076490 [Acytostelium subglobosum LB1]